MHLQIEGAIGVGVDSHGSILSGLGEEIHAVSVADGQAPDAVAAVLADVPAHAGPDAVDLDAQDLLDEHRDRAEAGPADEVLAREVLAFRLADFRPAGRRSVLVGRVALPDGAVVAVALLEGDGGLVCRRRLQDTRHRRNVAFGRAARDVPAPAGVEALDDHVVGRGPDSALPVVTARVVAGVGGGHRGYGVAAKEASRIGQVVGQAPGAVGGGYFREEGPERADVLDARVGTGGGEIVVEAVAIVPHALLDDRGNGGVLRGPVQNTLRAAEGAGDT